jgi:hypothetical protein
LASKDSTTQQKEPVGEAEEAIDPEDGYQKVGRKELHEQRAQFEERVFGDKPPVDIAPFKKYMEELFASDREATLTLDRIRTTIGNFAKSFSNEGVQMYQLKHTVENLLKQDLLSVRPFFRMIYKLK